MPRTPRSGTAKRSELSSALQRSDELAQRTSALVEAIEKENDRRSRQALR